MSQGTPLAHRRLGRLARRGRRARPPSASAEDTRCGRARTRCQRSASCYQPSCAHASAEQLITAAAPHALVDVLPSSVRGEPDDCDTDRLADDAEGRPGRRARTAGAGPSSLAEVVHAGGAAAEVHFVQHTGRDDAECPCRRVHRPLARNRIDEDLREGDQLLDVRVATAATEHVATARRRAGRPLRTEFRSGAPPVARRQRRDPGSAGPPEIISCGTCSAEYGAFVYLVYGAYV